jgi:hypothetical protein
MITIFATLFILTGCMAPNVDGGEEAVNLEEGLVALYTFDGNADDSSNSGLHGTVHGATPATDLSGKPNRAYFFDGIDDYIYFGPVLPDMDEMTVCAWICAENKVCFFNDADWAAGHDVVLGVGPRSVLIRSDKVRDGLREELPLGVGMHHQWRHIAWTLSAAETKVYIDGTCRIALPSGGTNTGYHHFIIGTHEYPKGRIEYAGFWKGRMSSFRIYSRVLNDVEIKRIYEIDA